MARWRRAFVLLRAASRLTPTMAMFMVRRAVRNRLAPRLPGAYRRRLAAISRGTPDIGHPGVLSAGLLGMAEFYGAEYRDQIDAVSAGRIRLHGREIDFGEAARIDWNHHLPEEGDHQMWRVKLAHMGFVGPMLAEGRADHHRAVARIITGFRERADVAQRGAFHGCWFPYAVSHRILAVGSGLLLARSRGTLAPEIDALVTDFLRENAAFLLDNVEHELCNNHVERNLAALCLYFGHVAQVPPRIAARLGRDVAHLTRRTILGDGVQIERSPMYQGLSMVSLAVMAETPFLSASLRDDLACKADAARRAFAILCHADGQVALFNDSWHGEVPHWDGEPAPDGRSLLPQGGYARLSQGTDLCLMDAGLLGPSWNPGHGHADFLALELDLGGRRLIVDPGTSRYNTGPDRARERSAAAHNGPVWAGREPVEFMGCFKVGRMAGARLVPSPALPPLTIGGLFVSDPGVTGRLVRHYPGKGFLVADLWSTAATQGQVAWLMPEAWSPEMTSSGLILRHRDGVRCVMETLSPAAFEAPEPSYWASRYGRRDPAWEWRLRPEVRSGRQSLLCWIGHDSAPSEIAADAQDLSNRLDILVRNA